MIFYFSGTGNSKHVAEQIVAVTGDKLISIEESVKMKRFIFNIPDGERVGFVIPTYFFGLPKIVETFMNNLQFFPKGDNYVFLVLTMGGSSGSAGKTFKQHMAAYGFSVDAYFAVVMPDTWTPLYDLTDTATIRRLLDAAEVKIEAIAKAVAERKEGDYNKHKGVWRFISPLMRRIYYKQSTRKFSVTESCVGCGQCAKMCPNNAILLKNGSPEWQVDSCDFCLRCLHQCPQFAIQYGKNTAKHGQYVHPCMCTNKEPILRFRPATINDTPFIAWVVLTAVGKENPSTELLSQIAEMCRREDVLYSWQNTILAEADGNVVGGLICYDGAQYAQMRAITFPLIAQMTGNDFSDMEMETQTGEFYLDSMAVLPEYRRTGVGTKLLKTGITRAMEKNIPQTAMVVSPKNPKAQHLYETNGFHFECDMSLFGDTFRKMVKRTTTSTQ